MIEGIGALDKGLRFVEVLRDSPGHGSNVLHGSFFADGLQLNGTASFASPHKTVFEAALRIISKKKEDGLEK